ncbi:MAG: hypothetical protein V1670_05285 [Candidatus Omnitrophota bacterium]
MAEKIKEQRKVSLTNTKQEMVAAYNELLKQLQEKNALELRPEAVIEQRKTKEIVEEANGLSVEGVIKSIGQLRLDISGMLGKIAEEMEGEVGRYRKVKDAVEIKTKELEEIYGIHKAAQSLAALIETQDKRRLDYEQEMEEKKNAFEHGMDALALEREEDRKRYDARLKEQQAEDNRTRQREKEDYEYVFKRDKQAALDKFTDEQVKKEKEFQIKREAIEKQMVERDNYMKESEGELSSLRKKMESFSKELELAAQKTIKETTEKCQAESRNREEFLKKSFEGERNVLQTRVDSFETLVKEQKEQLLKLSAQLEKAYQKVEDIAEKAVGGTSELRAAMNSSQWAGEQAKK